VGASATYRVGRSDFFTPGDLAADAQTLDNQVDLLDAQLNTDTGSAPQSWLDSWHAFFASWKAFYASDFQGNGFFGNLFTALNDSNRDELVSYEDRFDTWANDAKNYGAELPGGSRVTTSEGSGDSIGNQLKNLGLPSTGSLTLLIGVVAAGLILYTVVKK